MDLIVDNPFAPVLAACLAAAVVLAAAARLTGSGWIATLAAPVGVRPTDKADTVGFSARGSLKRSDFGMKTFIPSIGDKIELIIETEATR